MLVDVLADVRPRRPRMEVSPGEYPRRPLNLVGRAQTEGGTVRLQRAEHEIAVSAADPDGPPGQRVEVVGENHLDEVTAAGFRLLLFDAVQFRTTGGH